MIDIDINVGFVVSLTMAIGGIISIYDQSCNCGAPQFSVGKIVTNHQWIQGFDGVFFVPF